MPTASQSCSGAVIGDSALRAQTPELFGGKGGCFDGGKGDKSGKGGCFDSGMGDKSGKVGPYGKAAKQEQQLIKQLLQQQKQSEEREQALERRVYDLEEQVTHVTGQVRWMLSTLDRVMPLSDSGSGH